MMTGSMKFTATGIWRDTGNFVNNVIAGHAFGVAVRLIC